MGHASARPSSVINSKREIRAPPRNFLEQGDSSFDSLCCILGQPIIKLKRAPRQSCRGRIFIYAQANDTAPLVRPIMKLIFAPLNDFAQVRSQGVVIITEV